MYSNQFRACRWLLEIIRKKKSMTFDEISDNWINNKKLSKGMTLSKRSFHRYKDSLKRNFGVEISCKEGGDYPYYVKNPEVLNDNSVTLWMLNTLAVDEKLRECLSLAHRIRIEPMPSGEGRLDVVTDAMLGGLKLMFKYQRYGSTERKPVELGVCGLVMYHQRWYIIGEFDDKKRYTYALDRMWEVQLSEANFEIDEAFNVNDYLDDIYGIYITDHEVECILTSQFRGRNEGGSQWY